jgi:putative selenate reductase
MSELMRPLSFEKLINWMMSEYKNEGCVFGVKKDKFYNNSNKSSYVSMFSEKISSPVGAAAGPNTQLAQNILTAYLCGLKFIELKTVQIVDGADLRACIERPCISAEKEGYNCEWSTELTVKEAFDEYVKGWFLMSVAARELKISDKKDFLFNMSVGYDFEGITSEKIDDYIEGMKDASEADIFKECKNYLYENIDMFENLTIEDIDNISANISTSITLSTLHGCPPEEIEKIADYFIVTKNIHTYIKLNPTLLGFEFTREILDKMGYSNVDFDTTHFDQDLKYEDVIPMISRLKKTAEKQGVNFGAKITNTFPVKSGVLLPSEFMYMSGKALYPLSLNVAEKLSKDFKGELPISYSGGADYFNIDKIYSVGIKPITIATTILKPGGYARSNQLSEKCEAIKNKNKIDIKALSLLAKESIKDNHYLRDFDHKEYKKNETELPIIDCFIAPCSETGCPINQQIPAYLKLASEEKYEKAFEVIVNDNVLPSITGEICNHRCQSKCNRVDYDSSLNIRKIKKLIADNAQEDYVKKTVPTPIVSDKKVCIIGAGPAGVACGAYLRRNGISATVFERADVPMGVVGQIVPDFRIDKKLIYRDMGIAVKYGVDFKYGVDEKIDVKKIKKEYDFVVLATGALAKGYCPVKSGEENLADALDFLRENKRLKGKMDLGDKVGVIGGGDVAMDCARAAKRGGTKDVYIIYRRTKEFMPAEAEELLEAMQDGVELIELLSPVSYDGKVAELEVMQLGDVGADGRRKVSGTGEFKQMPLSYLISATGSRVDKTPYEENKIELDKKGKPILSKGLETNIDGVYVAGDCRQGPETIVQAMADAKKVSKDILSRLDLNPDFKIIGEKIGKELAYQRKGVLIDSLEGKFEGSRCLGCDDVCELCVDVCPNRANKSIVMDDGSIQILHIDGMCNECGNCSVFCPFDGRPYADKLTLFWSKEDMDDSKNSGFYIKEDGGFFVRLKDKDIFECVLDDKKISKEIWDIIKKVISAYAYIA